MDDLFELVDSEAAICPNEKFVLIGYSQGAAVIGDYLNDVGGDGAAFHSVVAAVMWADPRFNPASQSAMLLPDMGYLDRLGDMLVPLGRAEKTGAQKTQVAKQASKDAQQATRAGTAYGVQQDASEILTKVLDLLGATDALKVPAASVLTPGEGGASTVTPEVSATLGLTLGADEGVASVADALRHFSTMENVQAGKPLRAHTKQYLFTGLPQVLTIVLNRFTYTAAGPAKIDRLVEATDPLRIPEERMSNALKQSLHDQPVTYRLEHVVHHAGETPRSGHYTSYGRFPGSDTWYRHSDPGKPRRRLITGPQALRQHLGSGYIYVYVRNP